MLVCVGIEVWKDLNSAFEILLAFVDGGSAIRRGMWWVPRYKGRIHPPRGFQG